MLEFKPITESDLKWSLKLRNDNRKSFFHADILSWKDHQKWWKSWQENGESTFYVIWQDDVRVGTFSVSYIATIGWEVGNVVIAQRYRGKGILDKVIDWMKDEYGDKIFLRVRGDNAHAIAAYVRNGFKIRSLTMEL